jgi:hypothetical protein
MEMGLVAVSRAVTPLHALRMQDAGIPGMERKAFAVELSDFFTPPAQRPSVDERVSAVLAQIPETQSTVALWMPGTSDGAVHPAFQSAWVRRTATPAVLVPYEASWRLVGSLADGEAVLRGVLDGLAARTTPLRIFLAGESQGAWAIANVLGESGRRDQVARVAVFGMPGLAPYRPSQQDPDWLTINHDQDPVVYPVRGDTTALREAIDYLARGQVFKSIPGFWCTTVANPSLLGIFVWNKLTLLLSPNMPDPHNYSPAMARGVEFLLGADASHAAA